MTLNKSSSTKSEVVLVTGASGCLGHHTVKLLIERDEQVREIRCLDLVEPRASMRAELDGQLKEAEARDGSQNKRIIFIKGDVRDINIVERSLVGVDCVIHCAARQDFWHEPGDQDEMEFESINVGGTENLLKSCVRLGVPKFVHVSSFETFVSWHTIYYATESTIPDPRHLLFGPSASSKKEAENKVRQYANVKLKNIGADSSRPDQELDSLRAVIVRFTPIYGEHDQHYVSKLLLLTKLLGGKLQRFTNIWIRQQPIYAGNAAWSLLRANRRLDVDESISGEAFNIIINYSTPPEFHITDETPIGDPFDFMQPFAECRGMAVSKSTLPAWPVWFLLVFLSFMKRCLSSLDIFGLFTSRKSMLDEAKEQDEKRRAQASSTFDYGKQSTSDLKEESKTGYLRWCHLITPQNFYFMCNSLFLNRTKASLRLDYEPTFSNEDALKRSLSWYKNHLEL